MKRKLSRRRARMLLVVRMANRSDTVSEAKAEEGEQRRHSKAAFDEKGSDSLSCTPTQSIERR